MVTVIALSSWQACKIILKCPSLTLQEKTKMPVSKGSILFQIFNLFVKARVKLFPVDTLESNQSFTAGLLPLHSGHCSSIIKQHPLPRSTWLYCSMMYPQWSPASEWSHKNTGFNLVEKTLNSLLLTNLKDHPFQWVPPETISNGHYNIKKKSHGEIPLAPQEALQL